MLKYRNDIGQGGSLMPSSHLTSNSHALASSIPNMYVGTDYQYQCSAKLLTFQITHKRVIECECLNNKSLSA